MSDTHLAIRKAGLYEIEKFMHIENSVFDKVDRWTQKEFRQYLQNSKCSAYILWQQGEMDAPIAYCIGFLDGDIYDLLGYAMIYDHYSEEVLGDMFIKGSESAKLIRAVVPETELMDQMMLKFLGYECTGIIDDHYEDDIKGYLFELLK